jgi:hypothetical protein
MNRALFAIAMATAGMGPCSAGLGAEPAAGSDVIEIARSFPDGGGYKWEGGSGAPCAIEFDGATILAAQEDGTYCSGFTFAVVMRALAQRGLLEGKTANQVRRFQKEWYGAVEDAAEKQCALAVVELGVGEDVTSLEDAQPGDFVQLWRTTKSGHSVVLLELVQDDEGRVIGLHYRSSQSSTDGIGDRTEFFADVPGRGGKVDRRRTYVARLFEAPR